jgi:hypothetical protein
MSEENFKTCRYCGEQIKAIAKVCPRCRQWLSILSWRNPAILMAATSICFLLVVAGLVFGMHRILDPGIDFFPYHSQVYVVDSHFIFGTNTVSNLPFVGVVAVVTNQSDKAWASVELEARYFDKTGKLIDVGHSQYPWTLYAKSDGAVRVSSGALYPFADYASYKIYLGGARDAHSRF